MPEAGDRTERATPRRREEARKHGQVALSPEVAPVAVLLAALALGSWGAPVALARGRTALAGLLAASGPVAAHDDPVGPLVVRTLLTFGGLLAPFCVAAALVGAGAVVAQVGWSVNPGLLLPDPGRINPSNGLKRIFSANGAMNLVKAVAKIAVVATVAYRVLLRTGAEAIGASGMMPAELLGFTGAGLRRLFLTMAVALAVLGGLDYLWQRRRHEQSLKMSRHEVKEEHKETEGDPQVKGRFRRAHREIARRRMLTEVKRADVVLPASWRRRSRTRRAPRACRSSSGARWPARSSSRSRWASRSRRRSTARWPRSSPTSTRCAAWRRGRAASPWRPPRSPPGPRRAPSRPASSSCRFRWSRWW
ncbi:MAG: EscU/YscU/HrcU family type III secretion system export apparatus switch protein [Deltaproteobacteria bacterium]|nr:MAG: EscU/YscU/HrcU family type III secretion system export apparatus switch protein [Deltaproteobacteria bacterium]